MNAEFISASRRTFLRKQKSAEISDRNIRSNVDRKNQRMDQIKKKIRLVLLSEWEGMLTLAVDSCLNRLPDEKPGRFLFEK